MKDSPPITETKADIDKKTTGITRGARYYGGKKS